MNNEPVAWMQISAIDGTPMKASLVQTWADDIPLYTAPQIKELSDAIKIIEELKVDADMNYKDYENTYADGWDDAFNEILSALYERDGIK